MTRAECIERIARVRPRVAVVGDYMLDGWWTGRIERIAREAPVPVVALSEQRHVPGGAANTALTLASLGAHVLAVGSLGLDGAAEELRAHLIRAHVDVARLARVPGARTTTKVRVAVDDQLLLRLDRTQQGDWPSTARRALVAHTREALAGSDALLICDYGSALLDDTVVAAIAKLSRPPVVIVDAHDPAKWRRLRPDVITPNAVEAERVLGVELGSGDGRADRAARAADRLQRATGARAVLVTLDRTGTVLLRPGLPPHRTTASPAPEHQASGAGDVLAATLTAALAAGSGLEDAVETAQAAADIAVARPGTCVCTLEDLTHEHAHGGGVPPGAVRDPIGAVAQ